MNKLNQSDKFSEKQSPIAIILCTFLGSFGIHRFYTGYFWIGLFQLLTFGGFIVWLIIDIIALYRNKFNDSKGNPLKNYSNKIASGLVIIAILFAFCWAYTYLSIIDNIRVKINTKQIATPLDSVAKANKADYTHMLNQNENNIQEIERREYSISTKSGINILKDEPCKNEKNESAICGTIINESSNPAKNIVIKIELYDKEKNFIAFSEAKIYTLAPGAQWDFKAPIFYNTVSSYKIVKISSN